MKYYYNRFITHTEEDGYVRDTLDNFQWYYQIHLISIHSVRKKEDWIFCYAFILVDKIVPNI